MNLFKKIFWKNFSKTPAMKLADDLDPKLLKGSFQITEYDPMTGRVLGVSKKHNTLVNQSKTNLIRLISQGQSPWLGTIDPTQLKISKMRFGNNDPGTASPSKLLYYKITEPSSRTNIPLNDLYAGGSAETHFDANPDSEVSVDVDNVSGNWVAGATTDIRIFTVRTELSGALGPALTDNPPSHGTFKIELYKTGALVETIYFYDPAEVTPTIYIRGLKNPFRVASIGSTSAAWVMFPSSRTLDGGVYIKDIVEGDNSLTYLYYDYSTSEWKFQLQAIDAASHAKYDKVRFIYERGKYNVVNSIVPRDSYNVGSGVTFATRFPYVTAGDYYPILSSLEYRDGDTDFVDDYSVTFAINMSSQYGNGVNTNPLEYITYKEAYLFNELDEMFSGLFLTTSFDKNALKAYYISWTIISPLV